MKKLLLILTVFNFISIFQTIHASPKVEFWPLPIRSTTVYIRTDGCCINLRVTVEQFDGFNWSYVGSGIVQINAFDDPSCCDNPGIHPDGDDFSVYDAYYSDDEIRASVDESVAEKLLELSSGKKDNSENVKSLKIRVYPNPSKGIGTISIEGALKEPTTVNFEILDVSGKKIFYNERYVMHDGVIAFSTHKLPSGTYVAKVLIGVSILTEKFIID